MINPHAYRQKAAGLALDRGLYDVASYIMSLDLSQFRHGTPVDVCRMIAGRLKPPKPDKAAKSKTEVKKMKNFKTAWYLFVIDGGDNAILVTKDGIWYSDMMTDLWWKHYSIDVNDVAGTIDGIRAAIDAGECFDASEMIDEINADFENMGKRFSRISEYDGLTADEIDTTAIIDIIEI